MCIRVRLFVPFGVATDLVAAASAFSVGVYSAGLRRVALIAGVAARPVAVAATRAGPVLRCKQPCKVECGYNAAVPDAMKMLMTLHK